MKRRLGSSHVIIPLVISVLLVPSGVWLGTPSGPKAQVKEELAPFVPSPQGVVDTMLRLAEVKKDDVLYDLGSGDGRIVIAAAKKYGARAVGFEIDDQLIAQSRENARKEGVAHLVEFRKQDAMTVDLAPATVVTLYLLPESNMALRPRILSQLRPGARVVSHDYHMDDWPPQRVQEVREPDRIHEVHTIYMWRIGATRPPQ
ncbi:MAG: class I SAM-dependent methyltransferase [Candidatus Rokubacteria bacterium]|nr:class I SAM-dependent methyltransferase [Candidatus Rokubacteria bacterium]